MEKDRYKPVKRDYVSRFPRLIREHVFDKLRLIEMTLAEFKVLLDDPNQPIEVIGEAVLGDGQTKELLLVIEWSRPLHVAIVVDEAHAQERVITVYEPDESEWAPDKRRKR